jgi:hypothetical protein
VIRRVRTLSGFIGRIEMRRRFCKSEVKAHGSTVEKLWKLQKLRQEEANGIPSGAVKCVDIGRNISGEGDSLVLV